MFVICHEFKVRKYEFANFLKFSNTSLPTKICRVKAALRFKPHTTGAAGASAASNASVSLDDILHAAGWSSESTFAIRRLHVLPTHPLLVVVSHSH